MALPYIVGVAGGSGSGKTTVAKFLAEAVPTHLVSTIEHDSYYRDRPDLTKEERDALNFDHPQSLETELMRTHIAALRAGRSAEVPVYDFAQHRRSTTTRTVNPTPIIVVEGILVFVDPLLRDLFDVRIFVDTDADIRAFRRIRRDIEQRGRTFASVREQYYKTVRPMHLEFVEPSRRFADIIIPDGGENRVALDLIVSKMRFVLGLGPSDILPPGPRASEFPRVAPPLKPQE